MAAGSVLVVAWIHGCLGLYQWLRLKPMFTRWMPYLFCGAVLLPVLALLGFYQGGRTVRRWRRTPPGAPPTSIPGKSACRRRTAH